MANARFLDPSSIPLKRQGGGTVWATLIHVTQGIGFVLLVSCLLLFFVPVIEKGQRLQAEKARLTREVAAEQEEQQLLLLETEHMKTDPAYVEHIARDRLNMGKPGETIIRFDPYQPVSTASRTVTPQAQGETGGK